MPAVGELVRCTYGAWMVAHGRPNVARAVTGSARAGRSSAINPVIVLAGIPLGRASNAAAWCTRRR